MPTRTVSGFTGGDSTAFERPTRGLLEKMMAGRGGRERAAEGDRPDDPHPSVPERGPGQREGGEQHELMPEKEPVRPGAEFLQGCRFENGEAGPLRCQH